MGHEITFPPVIYTVSVTRAAHGAAELSMASLRANQFSCYPHIGTIGDDARTLVLHIHV
jgi:hypothetical protein